MSTHFKPGGFPAYGIPFDTDSRYTVKERHDLFGLLPQDFSAKSVLEVGCANGDNLRFFSAKLNISFSNSIGVDICRSTASDYAEMVFHHSSAEDFFAGCSSQHDLIVLSDVLEHIYNPWELLKNAKKHLSSAGIMLISVPNLQNLNYLNGVTSGDFVYQSTGLFDETHIRFFTKSSLSQYLQLCDYKIVQFGWRPDLSLGGLRESVQGALETAQLCPINLANVSIGISKENIDLFFGQQILVAVTHE